MPESQRHALWAGALLMLVLFLAASGCTKLTPENYAKIKVGMPYAEVAAILGEPAGCDAVLAIKSCRWADDARKISIQFVGEQVVMSSAENLR
jgi:hypothetical protein